MDNVFETSRIPLLELENMNLLETYIVRSHLPKTDYSEYFGIFAILKFRYQNYVINFVKLVCLIHVLWRA
jgi:hypothetical protein